MLLWSVIMMMNASVDLKENLEDLELVDDLVEVDLTNNNSNVMKYLLM